MILTFMTGSAPVWLATNTVKEELGSRMVHLARFFHAKAVRSQLPSWRVRLALVIFIDEYLDYEPDQSTWTTADADAMDTGDADILATDIVAGALVDPDIRLRFRAATSTAGILYLSSIPIDQHVPFYHDTVVLLPREIKHWDSFVTDILWKLNCCITSPQLRAATIYHLYEVPPATAEFNNHLQTGLETVSIRLGLSGIAPLCLAHAPLIISSQICGSQSPMRVPHRLYGFGTRKAFAITALER
jgi:ataxia telangiectasia mutated family protein